MNEPVNEQDYIDLKITPRELRYFVSCGLALIQNIPGESLSTYCGLSKDEIIEISLRLREVADRLGVDM
uniref:Uncharacterized protein n=1 Tax=Tanacetum cinerariifolium TaxID=118510 RepID=A0A699UYL8_TANCI|nr:hypothetical protein [Tanacetum cinerariifolium]